MNNPMDDPNYIKISQLVVYLSLSKSTILNLVREGRFPKPYRFGDRIIRWKMDEIKAWAVAQRK